MKNGLDGHRGTIPGGGDGARITRRTGIQDATLPNTRAHANVNKEKENIKLVDTTMTLWDNPGGR